MNSFKRLGPGVLIAATAVGISHLVQSTRAGADFGLSMAWLIVVIVLLKYPAFRFAADYAATTGKSLVHAYRGLGKLALFWLIFAMMIELFVGVSAVSLATSGIVLQVTGIGLAGPVGAILVALLTAVVLWRGSYVKFESMVKALVAAFTVLVLAATVVAVQSVGGNGGSVFPAVNYGDKGTLLFVLAMTGWMPLPLAVTAFQSVWIREKVASGAGNYGRKEAVFDLSVGWIITTLLALCFLLMGAAVLFLGEYSVPTDSVGFAASLFSIFTELTGAWVYPLVAIGGIAVVWSTLVAVMDGVSRILDRVLRECFGEEKMRWSAKNVYRGFLLASVVGVSFIMLFLVADFATFIDFAASVSFIVSPAIAYFNYRALKAPEVASEYQPSRFLVAWNWFSIVAFVSFAMGFFYLRFLS